MYMILKVKRLITFIVYFEYKFVCRYCEIKAVHHYVVRENNNISYVRLTPYYAYFPNRQNI